MEEIAKLGSEPQPLVFEKGRLYFTEGGKLISVDPDGEDRQETVLDGMAAEGVIRFSDEEYFYCVDHDTALHCWRVSKADSSSWEKITIPRAFRSVDLATLKSDIIGATGAIERQVRIKSAQLILDSNGTPAMFNMDVIAYAGPTGSMKVWNSGNVMVQITLDGYEVSYHDNHLPLSLSEWTTNEYLPLETYMTALQMLDENGVVTASAKGEAESFRLMYEVAAFDDAVGGETPAVSIEGLPVQADLSGRYLVYAQAGGCDSQMTDGDGVAMGNLMVVALG